MVEYGEYYDTYRKRDVTICEVCGCNVENRKLHDRWHDKISHIIHVVG